MGIYLGLIAYILILPLIVSVFTKSPEKKRHAIAFWGMFAIFLLLALKGDVGSDISGYRSQYYLSAEKAWTDIDYVYFEAGYITLTKIFSKLGFDFQFFMASVYALACWAMYQFIKRFSLNPTFSLIIFVCYQFFVFYISGVRQTIAMSLCIISFLKQQRSSKKSLLAAFLLICLAISIHKSAILYFVAFIFYHKKSEHINFTFYCAVLAASIVFRPLILLLVNLVIGRDYLTSEITLAGNFIMLVGLSIFMYCVHSKGNILKRRFSVRQVENLFSANSVFFTRTILLSLIANIVFSGSSLLRSAMYLTIFLIPGLPNTTYRLKGRMRLFVEFSFIVFFIVLFYHDTLSVNQLELCPYSFFWQ